MSDPFGFPIVAYFRKESSSYADYIGNDTTFGSAFPDTNGYYNDSSYGESASYGYGNATSYGEPSSYGYGGESSYYGSGLDSHSPLHAKKEYEFSFSYGVVSVAVVTLCLVILIEQVLLRIDLSAAGKPFYQAVLDAVYRELAVLGIVELGIYIVSHFYEYEKNMKAVFADVHFLLFYTDIFNALQAVVQAWATNRVSNKLWVRTEELELNHYCEIREEFDRVHKQLYGVEPGATAVAGKTKPRRLRGLDRQLSSSTAEDDDGRIGKVFQNMLHAVFYPRLKAKHNQLLVQIRFHKLRVSFLQAYNLPLKLKVSDYLMRSESNVLTSLVHISPIAWLWLAAMCNLMYWFAGLMAEVTGDAEASGITLSCIFFINMLLFIVVSLAVHKHMNRIFMKIMKSEHLWPSGNGQDFNQDADLAAEQRELFFLGDPSLVITLIQFMQFGYAIALSVVLTYWGEMQKDDEFAGYWYLVSLVVCYAVFVYVVARVIPRYTLVTKLGQLVDKKLLHETLAAYKLKEAERLREQNEELPDFYTHDYDSPTKYTGHMLVDATEAPTEVDSLSSPSHPPITDLVGPAVPVPSTSAIVRAKSEAMDRPTPLTAPLDEMHQNSREERRRMRKKSQSEGVALMRHAAIPPPIDENEDASHLDLALSPSSSRLMRRKSRSAGVGEMSLGAAPKIDRELLLADLVKLDTQAVKSLVAGSTASQTDREMRRGRKKSRSTGVDAMVKMASSLSSLTEQACVGSGHRRSRSSPRSKSNSSSTAIQSMLDAGSLSNGIDTQAHSIVDNVPRPYAMRHVISGDTLASVGELSDVDEISDVDFRQQQNLDEPLQSFSLINSLRNFFLSKSYGFTSNVLGTMVCFFWVGMRIEGFLQKQCIIPENDYSWDLPLYWTFLFEAIWLLTAVGTSAFLLLVFVCKRNLNKKDWEAIVSAIIDLVITGTCLGLLLEAEARRCCKDGYARRFLADDGDVGEQHCNDATFECSCADFGFRVYGSLGSLEPWTALVALRIFRFILARKIVKCFVAGADHDHEKSHSHDHGRGHEHGHCQNGPEVVADAWQAAVAKHPELVAKFGEFSGEILQAMLGLEVIERRLESYATKQLFLPASENRQNSEYVLKPPVYRNTLEDERFKCVAPKVQEICPCTDLVIARPNSAAANSVTAPMAPLEFDFAKEQAETDRYGLSSDFEYPNARIIRSIRRCDRKYFPLLNTWTSVDVIMTKYEMVYVDVNSFDGSDVNMKKRDASRRDLMASNGGKGLRLCDVTAGRRVVGHLNLSDITAVHVEREAARADSGALDLFVEQSGENQPHELWHPLGDAEFDGLMLEHRWACVQQDRLKIETLHGTLYLRFYSDLLDGEAHPERFIDSIGGKNSLHKDIALQWAQTIVRNCVDQLKQPLPYIGNNNDEELRDYLQIISHSGGEKAGHRRIGSKSHHRAKSSIANFWALIGKSTELVFTDLQPIQAEAGQIPASSRKENCATAPHTQPQSPPRTEAHPESMFTDVPKDQPGPESPAPPPLTQPIAADIESVQPTPMTQKYVTFINTALDPTLENAELYYESTRWGPMGHSDPPVAAGSFPGHKWFLVVNGARVKKFVIGQDEKQSFTF